MVANIFPPMLSLTQSFLEEASGAGTNAVARRPKSPDSVVLATSGGGLVAMVDDLLVLSSGSGMGEVLKVECGEWVISEWESGWESGSPSTITR